MKLTIAVLALVLALFSATVQPSLVGEGVISTPDDETAFAPAPDGNVAFLARNSPTTAGVPVQVLYIVHWENGHWGAPQIAAFSGQYRDFGPAMSPDGSKLFFISNRPVKDSKSTDMNIWMVSRADQWSEPQPVHNVNSPAQEYGVSVAANSIPPERR